MNKDQLKIDQKKPRAPLNSDTALTIQPCSKFNQTHTDRAANIVSQESPASKGPDSPTRYKFSQQLGLKTMKIDNPSAFGRDSRNTEVNNEGREINYGNRSPGKLSVTERSLRSSGTLHLSPSKTKLRDNSKNNMHKMNSKTQTGQQHVKKEDGQNQNINGKKKQNPNQTWRIIASSIQTEAADIDAHGEFTSRDDTSSPLGVKVPRMTPDDSVIATDTVGGAMVKLTQLPVLRLSPKNHSKYDQRRPSQNQTGRIYKKPARHHPILNATLQSPQRSKEQVANDLKLVMIDVQNQNNTFQSARVDHFSRSVEAGAPATAENKNNRDLTYDVFSFQEMQEQTTESAENENGSVEVQNDALRQSIQHLHQQLDKSHIEKVIYKAEFLESLCENEYLTELYLQLANANKVKHSTKPVGFPGRVRKNSKSPGKSQKTGDSQGQVALNELAPDKHIEYLQTAIQKCGGTLKKTWNQMTPYEQAKVESEYFKLLKKDCRIQQDNEQKAGGLSNCLNLFLP